MSNREFLFNSRSLEYKFPFGAVSVRENVHILFPIREDIPSRSVTLVLRRREIDVRYELVFRDNSDGYNYYEVDFSIPADGIYFYRFEITFDGGIWFVGRERGGGAVRGDWLPEWQLTVSEEGFKTPDWLKGGVVYHIFVDRFFHVGENKKPPYGVLKNWNEEVTIKDKDGVYRADDFYGGNLRGVIEKLDYLKDLGVTAVYLSPIFESHSNHRYDTGDYMKIDPLLGDESDFRRLVEEAEKAGMGIILDGVFNHTGADSKYFNKFNRYDTVGACQSETSPYYNWYTFDRYPDEYRCWWSITSVPAVARNAYGFQRFILGKGGVIEKWTDTGIKGWRLDVVDELPALFVRGIRRCVKRKNEDCVVIGEVWEDASTKISYGEEREYLRGEELDGVLNYVFKRAILNFLIGGSGEDFSETVMNILENYPEESVGVCFTLLGSHDTVRAINVLSGAKTPATKQKRLEYRLTEAEYERGKRLLKLGASLQFFLPGVPCVYYGDEIGMQGYEDPINRRPFAWDKMDVEIVRHYEKLGALRREHREEFLSPAFVSGNGGIVEVVRDHLKLRLDRDEGTTEITFP